MSENPYSASDISAPVSHSRLSAWRFVAATILSLSGMLLFFGGIMLATEAFAAGYSWDEEDNPRIAFFYLGAVVWMCTGLGWIFAGSAFVFGRYRLGTCLAIACFGIFALWLMLLA